MKTKITRRSFIRSSALSGAGLLILTRSETAFGYSANSKLNVAGIGVGGRGADDINEVAAAGANIVALCDVDQKYAGHLFKKFPKAKRYKDFRVMLDEMDREIEGVVIGTPDHTHAVTATAAMHHGKAVYCEKPLTRTVHEARVMRETALRSGVVTQMGNQGSASTLLRRAVELAWGGVIGEIREAHVWFDGGNGPKTRPTDNPPVPPTLDWDLWLGPAAWRPYNPCYLPGIWRNWRAFGSGIVGDFGCHTANIMFRALHLERLWNFPAAQTPGRVIIRVAAQPSEVSAEGYPASMRAELELPARGELPPVKLTLYAKEKPDEALMLGYPRGGWGDLLVGSKGSLYSDDPWNTRYVLLPESKFDGFKGGPPESLPRSKGHHREWVDACKGEGKTFSPFEIGGPLTEIMQLANLATLVPETLEYDTVSGRILNSERGNELLHRTYRGGWQL